MRNMRTAIFGSCVALTLASTPSWAFVSANWSGWATASDNFATADPTMIKPFNGLTDADKTIALVDYDASVTIQGTPQNAATLTSNVAFPGNASALPGGTGPTVEFQDLGNDLHQVTFAGPGAFPLNGITLNVGDVMAVQYVINIDTSFYPAGIDEKVFGSVSLGLNVNNPGDLTVSKRVQGLTPNSITGGAVQWSANTAYDIGAIFDETLSTNTSTGVTVFCGVCTTFLVTDYVRVDAKTGAGGTIETSLSSMSNTFQQTFPAPAPAPLALLGIGMLGLTISRRVLRKKSV
jgi:hypothetical protein